MSKNTNRTVWPSEHGDLRKSKEKPGTTKSLLPEQQTVYLHRESSGRGGKAVRVMKNLVLSLNDLKTLAKELKACGTGGIIQDGIIEIQGEQREKVAAILRGLGYKVKIAGG